MNLHLYLVPNDAPNAKSLNERLTTGHGRYRLNAYLTHRLLKARRKIFPLVKKLGNVAKYVRRIKDKAGI